MRRDLDAAVEALAAQQRGVWTFEQVKPLGITRAAAAHRARKGLWQRPYTNTYAHRAWVRTFEAEVLAAAWSVGGVASHEAAARVHRLPGIVANGPEVSVARGGYRARPFPVHTPMWLPPQDQTIVRGIPCTSLARTLVDLADRLAPWDLESLWDGAILSGSVTTGRLERTALPLLGRGHPGSTAIRRVLDDRVEGEPVAESVLESALFRVLDGGGYGPVVRQAPLRKLAKIRGRADAYLPHVMLVVEADGRRWHARLNDFDRDAHRDNELQANGITVMRFTHRHLTEELHEVIRLLDAHFSRCGWSRRNAAGFWVRAA